MKIIIKESQFTRLVENWFETHRDIHQLDDKGIKKVMDKLFEYERNGR